MNDMETGRAAPTDVADCAGIAAAVASGAVTARAVTEAALARIAAEVNGQVENIGARRLQTVMEKLLEDVSFEAEDRRGDSVVVDAAYVEKQLSAIARDTDLSKYVL